MMHSAIKDRAPLLNSPTCGTSTQRWSIQRVVHPEAGAVLRVPANRNLSVLPGAEYFQRYGESGLTSNASKSGSFSIPSQVPNLWLTQITPTGRGLPSIAFLRSGTIVPVGVTDESLRRKIADLRLSELWRASEVLRKAGRHPQNGLLSIDLQTAGVRKVDPTIEILTVSEKEAAIARWNAEVARQRHVPSDVGPIHSLVIPCEVRHQIDRDGFVLGEQTSTQILQLCDNAPNVCTPTLQPVVLALAEQCRDLLARDTIAVMPSMRYALAARVVVLASLTGTMVHFNCRSGKDRTGLVDSEIIYLGYELSKLMQGRVLSAPGLEIMAEDRSVWEWCVLRSGNLELQALNTGVKGFKLKSQDLVPRIGSNIWNEFLGDSHLAAS